MLSVYFLVTPVHGLASQCVKATEGAKSRLSALLLDARTLQRLNYISMESFKETVEELVKQSENHSVEGSENIYAFQIFYQRQRLITRTVDPNERAAQVNEAMDTWYKNHRPRITPRFLEQTIDPLLNVEFVSPLKSATGLSLLADAKILKRLKMISVEDYMITESSISHMRGESSVGDTTVVVAKEIIKSRYKLVHPIGNLRYAEGAVDRAYRAWLEAGSPAMVPKVIEGIIDRQLSPALFTPKFNPKYWEMKEDVTVLMRMGLLREIDLDSIRERIINERPEATKREILANLAYAVFKNRIQLLNIEISPEKRKQILSGVLQRWRQLGRPRLTSVVMKQVFDPLMYPE